MEDAQKPNPLLDESIMSNSTDSELLSIIQDSDDVNITNEYGDTPLHFAVKRQSISVPLELIKMGANINSKGIMGHTPLHCAVDYCNIEAVCLLLYYDVDVTVVCRENKVAFMDSVDPERLDIAYLLLNYHDEFPVCTYRDYTALITFSANRSPVAIDLVNIGVDVNSVNADGYSAITYSIEYRSPDLFKLLWDKIDYTILFLTDVPFLLIYLHRCNFSNDDWVECLYIVLGCDVALDLIEHCICYVAEELELTFFEVLLTSLKEINIALDHRINIIYTALTLGAEVYYSDVDWLVGTDFTEEILLLAYFSTKDPSRKPNLHVLSEYLTLTCGPTAYSYNHIYMRFMKQITYCIKCDCVLNSVVHALRYFALSFFYKHPLMLMINFSNKESTDFAATNIDSMPDFPTLTELCRNRVRTLIQENCNITKPYQFYDVVRKLPLPMAIQDVVSFKSPLYA